MKKNYALDWILMAASMGTALFVPIKNSLAGGGIVYQGHLTLSTNWEGFQPDQTCRTAIGGDELNCHHTETANDNYDFLWSSTSANVLFSNSVSYDSPQYTETGTEPY
ncbi:hypothetical protein [Chitinophaga barathri]|uniref:hypothetical protein n=1 Tax=Chitinophaga barathri TaxID=1647451 RepID=UPI000F5138CD|nr:hypothetical protein [Chitinophaga barathri]